jgi:TRAP-type C4-dicarboxylate transport system substrate-binding protein
MKPDLRDGVLKAIVEATTAWNAKAPQVEALAIEELKSRGVTVESCDRGAFRDRVRPLWASFAEKTPGAQAMLDAAHATEKA